jgi:histidine triad (HIT) family protein
MDHPCIFCHIADKRIPANVVFENEDVIAFLDISQTTRGHTLVIPKRHYDNMLVTPKTILYKVMSVAQRIGQAQMQTLKALGVNVISNNYPAAGQSVFHFHVHVIPRYSSHDQLRLEMLKNEDIKSLNLPVLAKQLKDFIK